MKKLVFILLLIALLLPPGAQAAPRVKVVASIFPLADLVRNVGGGHVEVQTLLPPGASPHVYEPTPSVMMRVAKAQLFVEIGAGLEFWADRLVSVAGPHLKILVLSKGMPLIGGGEEGANPHVWLDPVLAMEMVRKIEAALSGIDPAHAADYRKNADVYIKNLKGMDAQIRREVSAFRIKSYVSFHAAWDYFGRRYGLKSAGSIEEAPGREPTPRQIERIVKGIKEKGIRAVFAEPQFNPRSARIIAQEAGAKLLMLDPVGGTPGRDSYIKLMEYNLGVMSEAMK